MSYEFIQRVDFEFPYKGIHKCFELGQELEGHSVSCMWLDDGGQFLNIAIDDSYSRKIAINTNGITQIHYGVNE